MIKFSIKDLLSECCKQPNHTGSNSKCFYLKNHNDLVIISTDIYDDDDNTLRKVLENTRSIQEKLNIMCNKGVHCHQLFDFLLEKSQNSIFSYNVMKCLYTKMPGSSMLAPLYDSGKLTETSESKLNALLSAPRKHFDKFVKDALSLTESGLLIDYVNAGNFLYDRDYGFSFVDLGLSRREFGYFEDVISPAMDVAMGVAMIFSIALDKEDIPSDERDIVLNKYKNVFSRFVEPLQNIGITRKDWAEIRKRKFTILDQFSIDDFDRSSVSDDGNNVLASTRKMYDTIKLNNTDLNCANASLKAVIREQNIQDFEERGG